MRDVVRWTLGCILALTLLSLARAQDCDGQWIPGDPLRGTDGTVLATVRWPRSGPLPQPRRVAIAGDFSLAGSASASNIASWDPDSGQWSAMAGECNGRVNALTVLSNGDLIAGGEFTSIGGVAANRIARWDGTSWSALGEGFSGNVYSLATLPGDRIVAGGWFRASGNTPLERIAVWESARWNAMGGGFANGTLSPAVYALLVLRNGDLVAGGSFASAGGTTAKRVARWNGSSWSAVGAGFSGTVYALAEAPNGELIAGGIFVYSGTESCNAVARWNGTKWNQLGLGLQTTGFNSDRIVRAVTVQPNGDVIVGGAFPAAGNQVTVNNLARWNGNEWLATGGLFSFPGGVPSSRAAVYSLLPLASDEILVSGEFTDAGQVAASRMARWRSGLFSPVASSVNIVTSGVIELPNHELAFGGWYYSSFVNRAHATARLNNNIVDYFGATLPNDTTVITAFAEGTAGNINAAGLQSALDGSTLATVVKWKSPSWTQTGPALSGYRGSDFGVHALTEMADGSVLAVGSFYFAGDTLVNGVARWDGISWQPLGQGLDWDWTVTGYSMSVARCAATMKNGDVIVGGSFAQAGGTFAGNIARWNGDEWSPMGGLGSSASDINVYAVLVLPDQSVVAAGDFMSADNKTAMRVAHWNGASWSALGAGIEPLDYSHDGSTVYALARRANGDIVAGGRFSNAGTVPARNVARWNGHEWRPLGKGLNGTVDQLRSLTNGDLVACGWFTMAGDNASVRWARWTDRNEPIVIRNPADSHNSCGETSAFGIDLAAGYSDVSYIWRRNGVPISTGNTRYSVRSTPIRSELTIEHTSPSDAGVFDCVVSRSCGVSLSTPCELIVAGLCCPADLTSDGVVDDADFCVFAQAYDIVMCESQAMPRSCPADLNADALVDDSDFLLFVIGYFEIGCP